MSLASCFTHVSRLRQCKALEARDQAGTGDALVAVKVLTEHKVLEGFYLENRLGCIQCSIPGLAKWTLSPGHAVAWIMCEIHPSFGFTSVNSSWALFQLFRAGCALEELGQVRIGC